MRLPAMFEYPLGSILGRTAIGCALVAAGGVMLWQSHVLWLIAGVPMVALGGLAAASNLAALMDRERRTVVLDEEGVTVRYGFSQRYYGFLDYSDYRVARLGLRRFLTALPIEIDRSLRKQAEHVRVTIYDKPAFLTPMPLLGKGAPATLLEWQATLNELRRAAIATADFAGELESGSEALAAGAALWRVREAAGARPSRLSRRGYLHGRYLLAIVFAVLLLVPIMFAMAAGDGVIALCGAAGAVECLGIDPTLQQGLMIGGPLLALLVFVIGNARMTVRRAHDLDEDLPFWKASLDLLSRDRTLRWRLSREAGTAGINRFGPMPPE